MALGNNLRVIREARRESVRQCAAAVGMDPTQLSKVERGLTGCSDETKVKLSQHFGVGVTRLFFQEVVESNSTKEVAR